jgi:hypothetical protein
MKTFFLKVSLFAAIAIILSSCVALHNGYMNNSASLSSANFRYIKNDAKASETATYFLAIGGFKESLVAKAKEKLIAENSLKDNQALANITVNFKYSSYFGIVTTVTCTISTDIVEFYKDESKVKMADPISTSPSQVVTESQKANENTINNKVVSYEIGEKVKYFDKISNYYINAIITKIESNTITIEYSSLFKKKTVKVDKNEIRKL